MELSKAIPQGYKQTEVGVIPEDWEVTKLGELGDIVRGGSPRPAGDPKYFNGSFIPWLTVASLTNISENKLYVSETTGYLTEEGSLHSRTLEEGTVIIANSGATLGVAKILSIKSCANDGIAAIINHRKGNKQFICHFINSITKNLRDVVATGNGQPNLNTDLIREIKLPFPPQAEQDAIAAALSDVDALLAQLDSLIEKKRDLKQAAMQQLLTAQTRLPGFSGEWESKTIFEIAENKKELFDDGDWVEAEYLSDNGVRLIQTGNIGEGQFLNKHGKKFISEVSFKLLKCKALQTGDLLICRLAEPAGRACILPKLEEDRVITAVDVTIFRPSPAIANRQFLVQIFNTPAWFSEINERCGGSTRTRIARGELGRISIRLPSIDEQTAIAAVLTDMGAEITALEAHRDKTRALKQGMMQELLTGRIRLKTEE